MYREGGSHMIRKVIIDGLFNKNEITLDIKNELYLLTGDNGSGKTTILNIIYNVLTSEFSGLFNIKFKQIKIDFEENDRSLKHISVIKEKHKLIINYFTNETYKLVAEKNSYANRYNLTYITEEINRFEEDEEDDMGLFWGSSSDSIYSLINKYPQLQFIKELKESILYFPTFRRIESDLKILKQSTSINYEEEINIGFEDRRIVMGVNDKEIISIYKSYSDKIRKSNSEGLNELLKKFIKNLISSIDNGNKRQDEIPKITDYNETVNNLIDLVDKLGIDDGLNKVGIKEYFKEYEDEVKNVSELKSGLKEINKTHSKKDSKRNLKDLSEMANIVIKLVELQNRNVNLIFDLISLYGDHLNEQDGVLKPVKNLKMAFESFFKEKLELRFDEKNYSLELSTDFDVLSTGEKQLITLLSYISLIMTDNVFKPLVIIDEPELSLHISWQKKLLPNLLELSENAYLIATHSPYIANINYINSVKQLGDIDGDN